MFRAVLCLLLVAVIASGCVSVKDLAKPPRPGRIMPRPTSTEPRKVEPLPARDLTPRAENVSKKRRIVRTAGLAFRIIMAPMELSREIASMAGADRRVEKRAREGNRDGDEEPDRSTP